MSDERKSGGPAGIGGWLVFLIIGMMFLGPMLGIAITKGTFINIENHFPELASRTQWDDYKTSEWIGILIIWVISFYGGLGLMTIRTTDAIKRAKLVLWLTNPIGVIFTGIIIPAVSFNNSGKRIDDVLGYFTGASILPFIASLLTLWVWIAYLNKSERVKNTYYGHELLKAHYQVQSNENTDISVLHEDIQIIQPIEEASATLEKSRTLDNVPDNQMPTILQRQTMVNLEDWAYEQVGKELNANTPDTGLWTKAFAQAAGDDKQTRVIYIKIRVEKLIATEQKRLEQERLKQEQIREQRQIQELAALGLPVSDTEAEEFLNWCAWGFIEKIKEAVNRKPRFLVISTSGGNSGLHLAITANQNEVARFLLAKGANASAKNSEGKSAIDLAKSKGMTDILSI